MSTPLFNRNLFNVANAEFAKQAFVPAPNPAAAQQGAPAEGAPPPPPGAEGMVPPEIAAAAQGQAPVDPAAQQQAPPPGVNDPDTHRQIIREEIERSQAKPKPLSPKDRITRLEGLVLRMLEKDGLIQPDPAIAEPQSQQPGAAPGGAPGGGTAPAAPAAAGAPPAGAAPPAPPTDAQVKMASAYQDILQGVLKVARDIRDEHNQIANAEAILQRLRGQLP